MSEVITDAKGRKITLRKLNVLDQVRLLKAIGAEQSQNQPYVQIAMMAACVAEIDGIPVPMPRSDAQIEVVISRIDDAGFAAIQVDLERRAAELYAAAVAASDGEVKPADPLAPSA